MTRLILLSCSLFLAFLLAACGRGDGGGGAVIDIAATDPSNTAIGVGLQKPISATFKLAIDATTVDGASFTLTGPSGPVDGHIQVSVTPNVSIVSFLPSAPLAFDSDYTARLTAGIRDRAGNSLSTDHVWRFNTGRRLAAGDAHTCARLDDGRVKCWGDNSAGQLGLGDVNGRGDNPGEMGDNLPAVDLGVGRTAVQLVSGAAHTCARLDDGRVKCWGDNSAGQLGLGDANGRGDSPGEMGDNLPAVDLGVGCIAVQLVAGATHTCARLDNGQVKCWGDNSAGQLGLGDVTGRGDSPGEMGDYLPVVDLGSGLMVLGLSAGANHTCTLLDNGQVKCWGDNSAGQLGLGDVNGRGDSPGEMGDYLPVVDLGSGLPVLGLSADANHTCTHHDNGQVKCWGDNSAGQLGLGGN